MKNSVIFLRISYWIGAIVDAKAALLGFFPSLIPQLYAAIKGGNDTDQPVDILMTPLMVFAWTCLLIWADRKPLERKGVLLLTLIPVLPGILAIRIYRVLTGPPVPATYNYFTIVLVIIGVFFAFSYMLISVNPNFKRPKESTFFFPGESGNEGKR